MILERLNNGQYGVASWFYDFFEAKLEGISVDSIESRLLCLQKILTELNEKELFKTNKLVLSHRREEEDRVYYLENKAHIPFDIFEFIRVHSIEMKRSTMLYFHGISTIQRGDIQEIINGAIVIMYSDIGVKLITDSDAWLEYDLEGNDQKKSAAINAKRLKSALEEIEMRVGFEPVYDHSKYAYVHKYELKNYFEYNGTPEIRL
ncbi:MAG: hypothetical protein QE487_06305 [Fluviicola sp.]|nr:hypothetical protein [Fluviicola sp.]